jgi:hypothetical protein
MQTMLRQATEILSAVFEAAGETGVRQLYRDAGPPVHEWNNQGEIVPLGWAVMDGLIVFFMDRHMVPDGHGGFVCKDCRRGYFECICPPATF